MRLIKNQLSQYDHSYHKRFSAGYNRLSGLMLWQGKRFVEHYDRLTI